MNKIKISSLAVCGAALLTAGLYSCNNDNNDNTANVNSAKVSSKLANLNFISTSLITEDLLDMGVSNIEVNNNTISFDTYTDFYFHDKIINFSNYSVIIGDNYLALDGSEISSEISGDIVFKKNNIEVDLQNVDFNNLDEKDLVLFFTYQEFKSSGDIKMSISQYEAKGKSKPCPVWNIRRAVGWGASPDEAQSDLWYATREFAKEHMGAGCTSIGGVNRKVIDLGLYEIDLAIQSFCCP